MECYFSPHPASELARAHIKSTLIPIKYIVKDRTLHLLSEWAALYNKYDIAIWKAVSTVFKKFTDYTSQS